MLNKIRQAAVRRRAELFYQHLDGLFQITLRDANSAVKARTVTDSVGGFSITGVLPGKYVLGAERKMFQTLGKELSVSIATPPPDLRLVMKVASHTETVDVFQPQGYTVTASTVATKTDTPILETPFSIQVVPLEVLQDQQVTRLEQAMPNGSNVYQSRDANGLASRSTNV